MPTPQITISSEAVSATLWSEIEVRQRLNQHWTCSIVFRATPDALPKVEQLLGQPLRITTSSLDGTEQVLFSGTIIAAERTYEVWGSFGAVVQGASCSWQMDRSPQWSYYKKQSPTAIAQSLAGKYGVSLSGTIDGSADLSRVQWGDSDWQFLRRMIDDGEAWIRPTATGLETATAFQGGPTLNWREGEYGLIEVAARGRVRAATATGFHYQASSMRSDSSTGDGTAVAEYGSAAKMSAASRRAAGLLPSAGVTDRHRAATLDDYGQRVALEARRGAVSATLVEGVSRSPQVQAGQEVTLSGIGDTTDGTYGVIACTHNWNKQGYENHFTATTAKRWFHESRVTPSELDGLYPARVTVNNDPHNQGRIQVQYWWQQDGETAWVRLLAMHAGADRGMVFLPEVGDEVLIAFEEGDPERPVAVGSAWNGVHQPPAEGFWAGGSLNGGEFAANQVKRIVTRAGHRITLSDDPSRPSISLTTPRSTRVLLTERATETGRPTALLHSDGDVILSAPNGRIHLQSATRSGEIG